MFYATVKSYWEILIFRDAWVILHPLYLYSSSSCLLYHFWRICEVGFVPEFSFSSRHFSWWYLIWFLCFCLGSLAWNNDLLCSGSRDRIIFMRDVRYNLLLNKKNKLKYFFFILFFTCEITIFVLDVLHNLRNVWLDINKR